jgi:DNA (cytosine-5)-methyltransferase 1
LETEGYGVLPFLLPAAGVGAPHERYRIWFIAHTIKRRIQTDETRTIRNLIRHDTGQVPGLAIQSGWAPTIGKKRIITDTSVAGLPFGIQSGQRHTSEKNGIHEGGEFARMYPAYDWNEFPTQSPVCGGNDGIPNRVDRIAALGNAVVPQVVLPIFRVIEELEKNGE